ncbi:hypothetical protein [Vreelandella sp. H-I2]
MAALTLKAQNLPMQVVAFFINYFLFWVLVLGGEVNVFYQSYEEYLKLSGVLLFGLVLTGSLFGNHVKEFLVFFRAKDRLPGFRAFSLHMGNDSRVNEEKISEKIGGFPEEPNRQNKAWYSLYKTVREVGSVIEANKRYLLFRDSACLIVVTSTFYILYAVYLKASHEAVLYYSLAALCYWQILAIAARNSAVSLVRNVLAEHS